MSDFELLDWQQQILLDDRVMTLVALFALCVGSYSIADEFRQKLGMLEPVDDLPSAEQMTDMIKSIRSARPADQARVLNMYQDLRPYWGV